MLRMIEVITNDNRIVRVEPNAMSQFVTSVRDAGQTGVESVLGRADSIIEGLRIGNLIDDRLIAGLTELCA